MKKYLSLLISFAWAYLIWTLTTTAQIVITEDTLFHAVLMMGAHFIFFGILGALLHLTLSFNLSLITTSLYGALIEYVQLLVPGRTGDAFDWALDTIGALVFIMIMRKYTK